MRTITLYRAAAEGDLSEGESSGGESAEGESSGNESSGSNGWVTNLVQVKSFAIPVEWKGNTHVAGEFFSHVNETPPLVGTNGNVEFHTDVEDLHARDGTLWVGIPVQHVEAFDPPPENLALTDTEPLGFKHRTRTGESKEEFVKGCCKVKIWPDFFVMSHTFKFDCHVNMENVTPENFASAIATVFADTKDFRTKLKKVIQHIVEYANEHAPQFGTKSIEVRVHENEATVTYEDDRRKPGVSDLIGIVQRLFAEE
jgi:hypothetical protein